MNAELGTHDKGVGGSHSSRELAAVPPFKDSRVGREETDHWGRASPSPHAVDILKMVVEQRGEEGKAQRELIVESVQEGTIFYAPTTLQPLVQLLLFSEMCR